MLEPVGDNVLLEIVTRVDQFAGDLKKRTGLLVAKDSIKQDEPNTGRVYAISKSIKDPEYSVGDLVIFSTKEIFQGFRHEGKDLVSMRHEEIIGKINEEAA